MLLFNWNGRFDKQFGSVNQYRAADFLFAFTPVILCWQTYKSDHFYTNILQPFDAF